MVWAPSLGLQSRRAWLLSQTNKQIGLSGILSPAATLRDIRPRAIVSPSLYVSESILLTPPQLRQTLPALPNPSPRRRRALESPQASSRLTFLRSSSLRTLARLMVHRSLNPRRSSRLMLQQSPRPRTSARVILKPSQVVKLPTLSKPWVI